MQAFNLNTSSKIAESNLIATPHRCQPLSTVETHLNSFDRTGFAMGVLSGFSIAVTIEFLSPSHFGQLIVPLIQRWGF